MNLPNRITLFRLLLIPVIVIIAYIAPLQEKVLFYHVTLGNLIILILFLIASFSDFLDGYIARKRNIVTTFGKFADPLADKVLVLSLLVILVEQHTLLPAYVVIIILARELTITTFRILAATSSVIIPAGWSGKIKTNFQFALIVLLLINGSYTEIGVMEIIIIVVMAITVLLTIYSGVEYIVKNRHLFKEGK